MPLSSPLRIRRGTVQGTDHRTRRVNNQDKFAVRHFDLNGRTFDVGVLSDGMSGRRRETHSEVGAALLVEFSLSEIRLLLAAGVSVKDVPGALYDRCVSYIGQIARLTSPGTPEEVWDFIHRYLFATLLGFIVSDDSVAIFSAGDGVIIFDEEIEIIDQHNTPNYLAYHQVDRRILGDVGRSLPRGFTVLNFAREEISRLAIASDGIIRRDSSTGDLDIDPVDIDGIWNYEPTAGGGLQWWLNKRISESSAFKDDTTVITVC